MNDPVVVSVVVPVREAAREDVAAAIRSVLASDLRALEVILVENGTAEQSAAMVAAAADPRILAVRLRPGSGASRPRNVGIARARAPYVALLEPGDVIEPEMLSASVNALERYPAAGFTFADFECKDQSGSLTRRSVVDGPGFGTPAGWDDEWHLIPQAELVRALLHANVVSTSGVMLRKQLLIDLGPFDESAVHCADLDLWFRLAHTCDALCWSRIGHLHRCIPTNVTEDAHARAADCIAVLRREKTRHSDYAARRQLDRRIAQNIATLAYEERRQRRHLRSIASYAHAFATFPDVRWLGGMLGSMVLRQ